MLPEIFQSICSDLFHDLQSRGVEIQSQQIRVGPRVDGSNEALIRLELLRFGTSMHNRNYVPGELKEKIFYSFSFFAIAEHESYTEALSLTELLCDHFEKKPFVQTSVKSKEYEIGISVIEASLDEINQFWIAQQRAHQPVLFLQARVSEI